MSLKARTPIVEYYDCFAIELVDSRSPAERDRLTDQAIVVAYSRLPRGPSGWCLHAIFFDRAAWTRSGIRRWWAAHEVRLLAVEKLDEPVPEICRAYDSPSPSLPAILLCHRNTAKLPARQQIVALRSASRPPSEAVHRP